eukprot:XP_011669532.1 PREDICTED: sushi, nidogen and EGF-like domain-containing protein 1 [Strongylocentrotus purpuratus]
MADIGLGDQTPHEIDNVLVGGSVRIPAAVIRPLDSAVDVNNHGDTFFRTSEQGTDDRTFREAERAIRDASPEFLGRSLLRIVVVSWINVPEVGGPRTSTFQLLIGTDGELTYVIFNYERIEWVGYEASLDLNENGHLLIGDAFSDVDLILTSNYGVPGSWIFEISKTIREIGKVQCDPSNPCQNGGTCEIDECDCAEGFSGNFCHLDECNNRCLNGASCEEGNCTCPAGFDGDMCQDKRKYL